MRLQGFFHALLFLAATACGGASAPPPVHGPDLDPPTPQTSRADLAGAALAHARAVLGADPAASPAPPPLLAGAPGRRVYLCAWAVDGARCTEGRGDDLAGAVDRAARLLRDRHAGELAAMPQARLTLDVVRASRDVVLGKALAPEELGVVGLALGSGDQRVFLVPAELLTRDVARADDGLLHWPRLHAALAARNPDGAAAEDGTAAELFTSATWLERPGAAPIRLLRLHPADAADVDADTVLQHAVWAGDHLAAITGDDGGIRYLYDVDRDRVRSGINIIRHAGSIYALLMAYDRTRAPELRAAAERAIGFLLRHGERGRRTGPRGGGDALFILDEGGPSKPLPLGASALALVALV
ncbi:MAG TPA: hypothetical protein VL172_03085, partial [Kofleriaceae bacterium]|nr:hypothetical protein [Kofleriaceae bacterium]